MRSAEFFLNFALRTPHSALKLMPLQIPTIDNRRYQELLDESLRRVPVHNPEWTNFNASDPGVTLIEIFAFMTENLLYRANLIPERNRLKFLQLLGIPLQTASSARGIVTFNNERGPQQTITLNSNLEVRAGQVPFLTEQGLDVLPIDAQVFYKRKLDNPPTEIVDYYNQLYTTYQDTPPDVTTFQLYETVPLDGRDEKGVSLGDDTVDNSFWIALLLRASEKPSGNDWETLRDDVRTAIVGKYLNLGVMPVLENAERKLALTNQTATSSESLLSFKIPNLPPEGKLPTNTNQRIPQYKSLDSITRTDILTQPGVVEITLPATKEELRLWSNLDPLELGAGDFPPTLEDTNLSSRLITWIRVVAAPSVKSRLSWMGINAVFVNQRARISNEVLPDGTGEPDQTVLLSRTPVIPSSVKLFVGTEEWKEIDDLLSAGPEVKVADLRQPPGYESPTNPPSKVFTVNAESGEIKFGDGLRGARPIAGATIRASYDYSVGAAGNVGAGAINTSPALPAGIKVTNPIRTWGGADAETITEGEKQIQRYLQHRERLVTAADFETITLRTPGVTIGRVEVLPAYNPEIKNSLPGDAPGAVTLMLIPRYDAKQPDAPLPDKLFLDAVCRHLEPRRLVTTEIYLRGADYVPIWISVGIKVLHGQASAPVCEAVKAELLNFLSPLRQTTSEMLDNQLVSISAPQYAGMQKGWMLNKPISDKELMAVASRVSGVMSVNGVFIAEGNNVPQGEILIEGLELPRVLGISVVNGDPVDMDELRGQTVVVSDGDGTKKKIVPVPVIPEEC